MSIVLYYQVLFLRVQKGKVFLNIYNYYSVFIANFVRYFVATEATHARRQKKESDKLTSH